MRPHTHAWSYRAIRGYWTATVDDWEQAVFRNAWNSNETLIGNEFARWTRRNSSPEKFTERKKALAEKTAELPPWERCHGWKPRPRPHL